MIAAGAYLKGLREAQHWSQGRLAETIGVTTNTIWRIEAGRQEPKTAQIVNLLAALKGRAEDLARLINDPAATAADGYAAAVARFEEVAATIPPADRQRVADDLRRLADEIATGQASLPRV